MVRGSDDDQILERARRSLADSRLIGVAFLYGSFAHGRSSAGSDVDIAVAARRPLCVEEKLELATRLAQGLHREVDLLDLQTANGTILQQALAGGIPLFVRDKPLYAGLLKRMWYQQADMMPLYRRILAERRERFLHG